MLTKISQLTIANPLQQFYVVKIVVWEKSHMIIYINVSDYVPWRRYYTLHIMVDCVVSVLWQQIITKFSM